MCKHFIEEKTELLKNYSKVIFEYDTLIYTISYSDGNDGYMYECYDLANHISGDTLESLDGGLCTGSAKDAIEMAIGE